MGIFEVRACNYHYWHVFDVVSEMVGVLQETSCLVRADIDVSGLGFSEVSLPRDSVPFGKLVPFLLVFDHNKSDWLPVTTLGCKSCVIEGSFKLFVSYRFVAEVPSRDCAIDSIAEFHNSPQQLFGRAALCL